MNPHSPFFRLKLFQAVLGHGEYPEEVQKLAQEDPTLAALIGQAESVGAIDPITLFQIISMIVELVAQLLNKKGS